MKKKRLVDKLKKPMLIGGILTISLTCVACAKTTSAMVETTIAEITTAEVTTEVDINNETKDIGIYSTEAGGGYNGITSDGQAVVKLNTITLSSGYIFTEDEANYLDIMITAWIEKTELQRDSLDELVNDKDLYPGLSEADRVELVDKIVEKYPHSLPVEATKPASSKPALKPQETKPSTTTNKPVESNPKETKAPVQDNSGSIDWGKMAEEEMAAENEAIRNGSAVAEKANAVEGGTIDPEVLKGAEEAGAQGN